MSENSKWKLTKDKQSLHDIIDLDDDKNEKLQHKINADKYELKMEKNSEEQLLIDIANIKKEINESGYEENPQMKFCVRVEVEEYNEDIRHNIKIEIADLTRLNEAQSSNSGNNQENLSNGKGTHTKPKGPLKTADINLKKLYNEVNKIADTSTNPADKILAIELKNNWGMVLRPVVDNDPINAKIQDVIHKWKNWISASKYRDTPIFYKCYICKKSWWHLEPFRAHLPVHHIDAYRIELEEQLHEANVIAYGTINVPKVQNFKTDGECWKCNNPFEFHVSSKKKQYATYLCRYCDDRFYTCTDLQAHQGVCWQYLKHREIERDQEMKMCPLCPCLFPTMDELNLHLTTRHSVRSDHPIQSQYKICSACNLRYFIYALHYCPKKMMNFNCERCTRGFSSTLLVDLHTRLTTSNVECRLCRKRLTKKCMETLHYQNHTDKFKMAYKCAICTHMEVYLDESSAKRHRNQVHKQRYDKRRNYFEKVLLPSSYFPEEGAVIQQAIVVPPVIEEAVESDFPVFEAKEVKKTYQAKSRVNPEDELKLALTEIKKEMEVDYEVFPGCSATVEEQTFESHLEDGAFVFHEEPLSEEAILPEDIKMEIKSEPIDEEYEDDIIRLSIDLPTQPEYLEEPIKQEPKHYITIKEEVTPKDMLTPDSSYPRLRPMTHRKSKYKYPCSRCNRTFLTAKKYLLHFTTHGIAYMSCPVCLQSYENVTRLLPHLTSHVKQTYLKMRVIDKAAPGKKRKHARTKAKYQCKECKSKVEHDNLYSHWDTHFKTGWRSNELDDCVNGMSLQSEGLKMVIENLVASKRNMTTKDCVICHRHFERKNDSKRHLIEHLLTDAYCNKPIYGALRCQICHMGFQKPDHYKLHMRDHGSLPVYRCDICDRAFSDSSNFTKHKKVHNLQAVICDICSKKFQAKSSLVKHLEMHRTTKPIICQLCNRVSYTESAYKKHIRRFHDRADVKVKCQLCGKKYTSLKEKWEHLWLVHKERQHKADCPICKKEFRRRIDVKSHLMKEHAVLPARKARKTDDIEKFLRDNPSLEMTEGETLIVYE